MEIDHYENFPVASWLCPPAMRPAVQAIYHFARTADDIADEGDADPVQRRALLQAYGDALLAAARDEPPRSDRWPQVFGPLAQVLREHRLPLNLLQALLSAFEQDVGNPRYRNRAELLDYCSRSANPVGRLLLHLCQVDHPERLQQSDQICTALQLINFWQDLSVDLPRGRCYLPLDEVPSGRPTPDQVKALCTWARRLMLQGAPLAAALPGRFGWELRGVVLGGLRILEKIAAMDHDTLHRRPKLTRADAPRLIWRAMRWQASLAQASAKP